MEQSLNIVTKEFIAPSGYSYTIREQNGEDEEILSNQADAKDLMNLIKFIASIVVKTNATTSGKLLVKDVLTLPLLDKYAIIFQSRIFSIGNIITFEYDWGGDTGKVQYEQDLNDFLFEDYSQIPTQEELDNKPDAIPYYPDPSQFRDREIKLSSGKVVKYDLLDSTAELYMLKLPARKQTRNADLFARNLCLQVEGEWNKVTNLRMFSLKDMAEIRKEVDTNDPLFTGVTDLENPDTGEIVKYPILSYGGFFFPTEM